MPEVSIRVGVVAERRPVDHPWQDHAWSASAVLLGEPQTVAGAVLMADEAQRLVYLGATELTLATSETGRYLDNLMAPPPKLWVVAQNDLEFPRLMAVTADPAEAEAYTEGADNMVWVVEMPSELASEIAAFVDQHHVERVFVKRKRKQFDKSRGEA